ncbi:MAG TPA: hypothetical protein PKV62_00670 [Oscillospiraceae bacterium]|nr:hypothetical protein [Oscillospiraceae bacterium]
MISFRIGRTKITISPYFFALLTLFLLVDRSGLAGIALTSMAVHEAAHLLAAWIAGDPPAALRFSVFGMVLRQEAEIPLKSHILICLSGPAANLLLAAAFFAAGKTSAAAVNLLLGLFSLCPMRSTDIGSILSTLMPEKVFSVLSAAVSVTLFFLLIYAALRLENLFLLPAAAYLLLGGLLK